MGAIVPLAHYPPGVAGAVDCRAHMLPWVAIFAIRMT